MLPVARERGEAACLYVYPLVAVGLILVRGAGLHLGEALVRRNGVHLHPALPAVLLPTGGLVEGVWVETAGGGGQSGQQMSTAMMRGGGWGGWVEEKRGGG